MCCRNLLYQLGSGGRLTHGFNGGVQLLALDAMRASVDYNQALESLALASGGNIGSLGDQTLYTFLAEVTPLRYSSDTLQILFRYSSDTLQILFRYSSDTLQILFRFSSDSLYTCMVAVGGGSTGG